MIQFFHYHPILGLQYFSSDDNIILDIGVLPENFTTEKWLHYAKTQGIAIIDSFKESSCKIVNKIIHNLYE